MLLTEEERAEFGPWLTACVARSGISKRSLARAIGDDSAQRLARYLHGLIPTLPVLAKLVSCLGIPPVVALLRAGYLRELLVRIDGLSADANPIARKIAIIFAVAAFPRRDLEWSRAFFEHSVAAGVSALVVADRVAKRRSLDPFPLAEIDFDQLGAKLHPLLEHAADALAFRDVGLGTRRFAAAEYVNAWADQVDFVMAEQMRYSMNASLDAMKIPTPAPTPLRRTRT